MIKTINAWRGLIAIVVVLFHCGVTWVWEFGISGVMFFFISSAFLLARNHPFETLTAPDYKRFVVNHALRLYPLHWFALLLVLLLHLQFNMEIIGKEYWWLNVLLLQTWSPVHEIHYCVNPVTWYLSALMFCYVAYPVLAHVMRRWRLRYKVLLIVVLSLIMGEVLRPLDVAAREAIEVNPLFNLLEFVVGLALYHVYVLLRERYPRVSFRTATIVEVCVALFYAVFVALSKYTHLIDAWNGGIAWYLPMCAVLGTMAWLNGQEGALGRLLLVKPLQWIGSISFEIYVLQVPAFWMYNFLVSPVFGHYGADIYSKLSLFVLPLLFLVSWVVNRYFTRPLAKLLIKK